MPQSCREPGRRAGSEVAPCSWSSVPVFCGGCGSRGHGTGTAGAPGLVAELCSGCLGFGPVGVLLQHKPWTLCWAAFSIRGLQKEGCGRFMCVSWCRWPPLVATPVRAQGTLPHRTPLPVGCRRAELGADWGSGMTLGVLSIPAGAVPGDRHSVVPGSLQKPVPGSQDSGMAL